MFIVKMKLKKAVSWIKSPVFVGPISCPPARTMCVFPLLNYVTPGALYLSVQYRHGWVYIVQLLESVVHLIQMLKAALCIGIRRRGA